MDKRCVIPNGGGLDSLAAVAWAVKNKYKIMNLFVNYGQNALQYEYTAVKRINKFYKTELYWVGIDDLWYLLSGYIYHRNLIIYSAAAAWAAEHGIDTIITGARIDPPGIDSYKDASPGFIKKLETLLNESGQRKIKFISPFARNSHYVLRDCYDLGAPVELAWWCPVNGPQRCGACSKCKKFLDVGAKILDLVNPKL